MQIDHIGIATQRLDDATAVWRDALGLELESTEQIDTQGVRVAMFTLGESHIELLEPLSPDSPVGKFLEKRGPGIHHIAVRGGEVEVMFEEVDVRIDVGHNEQIGDLGVGIEQKSIARVIIQHNLIDLGESHLTVHTLPVIHFAVGPVPSPGGEAIGGDFEHDILWHNLEDNIEKIKA